MGTRIAKLPGALARLLVPLWQFMTGTTVCYSITAAISGDIVSTAI